MDQLISLCWPHNNKMEKMPKFAANLMYLFTELPFEARFKAAADAGFRDVEYQFPYGKDLDLMRDALVVNRLNMVLINAPAGDADRGERGIAALAGREADFRDSFLDALAHARELRCPRVHVMSGVVAEKDTALAIAVYAENLRFAARTAESAEINVVVEPINGIDVPGYLIQRTEQARALIAMVGEENLNLQYDVYHALMNGEDPIEGLRANFDTIRHIQVAGYPGRHEPIGDGYDMRGFFEACDIMGYAGVIGCEYKPATTTKAGLGWASVYGIS
jgi:hydroxypyruvate isomerase